MSIPENSVIVNHKACPCHLIKHQVGIVKEAEKDDGTKVEVEVYVGAADVDGNGIQEREVIDTNQDKKVDEAEVWAFFFRNINFMPEENVKAVVALIAEKVEKHGMAAKAKLLGEIAAHAFKYAKPYKDILVKASQSDKPELREAALFALKQFELADINARIAQYAPVELTTDDSKLTENQRKVKLLLIKAAKVIDEIYWEQRTRDGLALRRKLENSDDPLDKARLRYLRINYGRFDALGDDKAFIGEGENPEGSNFYPSNMTKEDIEAFLLLHPEQRTEFMKINTVIREDREKGLIAVPYEDLYRAKLQLAAKYLDEASKLTADPALKKYLARRAEDILLGSFTWSDIYWLEMKDSDLDIIIGPIESGDDGLTGVKASYEALVLQKDPAASQALEEYRGKLAEFQRLLPVKDELKTKNPIAGPIGVFDLAYIAGDGNKAIKPYAVNLPNDEAVRRKYGSRFILLRNVMEAKAQNVLFPIAERIIDPSQAPLVGKEEFARHGIEHELAHSLGLDYVVGSNDKVTIKDALKELYGGLEECKADVLAYYDLRHMGLTAEAEMRYYVTALTSVFRSVRFGVSEEHGRANLIQLNYLLKEGAIEYNKETGRWSVVSLEKMRAAIAKLSTELLEIQGYGDYSRAKKLVDEFAQLTPEIKGTLAKLSGIPVDLEYIQPNPPELQAMDQEARAEWNSQEVRRRKLLEDEYNLYDQRIVKTSLSRYSQEERMMIYDLTAAADLVNELELYFMDPDIFVYREQVRDDKTARLVFERNKGPWCRTISDPHCSALQAFPPRNPQFHLYPMGMTQAEYDSLEKQPNAREMQSCWTVIKRVVEKDKDGKAVKISGYEAVPFAQFEPIKERMAKIADHLKSAADFTDNAGLKKYLLGRAESFLSGSPFPQEQSDYDWITLDSDWEVNIGFYEAYEDRFGRKAVPEVFFGKRNPVITAELAKYKEHLTELEEEAADIIGRDVYKPRKLDPRIQVVAIDQIMMGGDKKIHKGAVVAVHLPNEGKSVDEGLYKKVIFLRSMEEIGVPLLKATQQNLAGTSSYTPDEVFMPRVLNTAFHEFSHGFGPYFEMPIKDKSGERTTVIKALGGEKAYYMEELKADAFAVAFIPKLLSMGMLTGDEAKKRYSMVIASLFWLATMYDITKAHTQAAIIQLGTYLEHGALEWKDGMWQINFDKMPEAARAYARRVGRFQATGDREGVASYFAEYNAPEKLEALHLNELRERVKKLGIKSVAIDYIIE